MNLDYATLDALRQHHPAWRLLRSDHAPLAASFLHRVFVEPNVRVMAQSALAEALEDELFALRERLGAEAFPKAALDYLNDWASGEKGWSITQTWFDSTVRKNERPPNPHRRFSRRTRNCRR